MESDGLRFSKPVYDACRECGMKHLSAAYSLAADGYAREVGPGTALAARAAVNLSEFITGYDGHWGLAIGFLARAEEEFNRGLLVSLAASVRMARRQLTDRPYDREAAADAMSLIETAAAGGMYMAHLAEAGREHPEVLGKIEAWASDPRSFMDDFIGETKAAGVPADPVEGKEGEDTMACCGKKKAVKAACKGGKCAAPAKKAKKGCK